MRTKTMILASCILALDLAAAAQTPAPTAPLLHHAFDENEQGWTAMGNTAKVSITHEAANVKVGTGALKFDYGVSKGELNLLLLMVTEPVPSSLKTVRFWIKTDYNASLAFAVQEREPGGRYTVPFFTSAGKWQQVEISLNDMILSDGKDDPKDPDGKLNPDQIAGCGILDASQIFVQGGDDNLMNALNVKTGAHTFFLDEFDLSADALPAAISTASGKVVVDTLARPQACWMAMGQVDLGIATGKPMEGRSLKADYKVGPGMIVGLVRPVKPGMLTGMKKLDFSIAGTKATKLIVQVEETDGGKYNAIVDVVGDSNAKPVSLAFSDFTASDDSKDANGTLEAQLIKSIAVIDLSGVAGGPEQELTLWLGPIEAQ